MAGSFDAAEALLLEEVRRRFQREEGVSAAYQGKTSLFLAFAGFFSALLGTILGKLLDKWHAAPLQWATLCTLGACLSLLLCAIYFLLQSALSDRYEILAEPGRWRDFVGRLVGQSRISPEPASVGSRALDGLQEGLLDAWTQATDQCIRANQRKAGQLARSARLLKLVVAVAGVSILLFGLQAVYPP